jgi:hypothetical protein
MKRNKVNFLMNSKRNQMFKKIKQLKNLKMMLSNLF